VQSAAGRASLGSAIGSMSLSRSIGGAIGVAIIGAVVFVSIGRRDGGVGALLARIIESGPESLDRLSQADRNAIAGEFDRTFRVVFLSIAAMTGIGALIATTVPKPKL
jgi:hypothetical protein